MLSGPIEVISTSCSGPTMADGARYILSIIPGKSLRDEEFCPGRVRALPNSFPGEEEGQCSHDKFSPC
jgi:hypothetical protein